MVFGFWFSVFGKAKDFQVFQTFVKIHKMADSTDNRKLKTKNRKPKTDYATLTPFQKATYPAICFAASFGSG
jgi:hypothetical protein